MRVSREEVQRVAALARLELTPDEEGLLVEHFDRVLSYMEKLNEIDTDNVEPMAHAVEVPSPLREDRVTSTANTQLLLGNAPARYRDFFQVPKVLG